MEVGDLDLDQDPLVHPYSVAALDPRPLVEVGPSLDRTLDPDPLDPSGPLDLWAASFVDPFQVVLKHQIDTYLHLTLSCLTLHREEVSVPGMTIEGLTPGTHDRSHHPRRPPRSTHISRPHDTRRKPGSRPHHWGPGGAGGVIRRGGPQRRVL